jgi:hypothetical protein
MPFSLPRRALLRSLAAATFTVPAALGAEIVPPGGRGAVSLPHLGQHKVASCAQTAHGRVKALMNGVSWPRSANPVASNRHCV